MMNVESKIISREISPLLWKAGETVCTAESCTSGQISAAKIGRASCRERV